MSTQVLEGTWEEIASHSKSLIGRRVRLTVLEDETVPKPNDAMLEALRKVSERSKVMRGSSDRDTQKLLREARSGRMFGRK